MSLKVCGTPIGNPEDITRHVLAAIEQCEVVIGEEAKITRQLLKAYQLTGRTVEEYNEHTDLEDLDRLVDLCRTKDVVLVADCGTPGFCDPASELVRRCRRQNIEVKALPGPSSLMAFLSVCGRRVDRFLFQGFLPRESVDRRRAMKSLPTDLPVLGLETPYRLGPFLTDLAIAVPLRSLVLALDLTQPTEWWCEGTAVHVKTELEKRFGPRHKAEIVWMLEPGR